MEEEDERLTSEWYPAYRELNPAAAPAFASAAAIRTFYAQRLDFDRYPWRESSWHAIQRNRARAMNEWIAAARRYVGEHPGERDRSDARAQIVESFFRFRYVNGWNHTLAWWGEDAKPILAAIEEFLAVEPESPLRHEMEFRRAMVRWFGRPRANRSLAPLVFDEAYDPGAVREALAAFDEIGQTGTATEFGGKAVFFALAIDFAANGSIVTPAVRERHAAFMAAYGTDHETMAFARWFGMSILPAFRDWSEFVGTDLTGHRWNAASMRGRVVLVDFWATWCGPCVAEIPALRALRSRFEDRGFEIVGVSLDTSRDDLVSWTTKNGVGWPQIHERGRFLARLPRRFGVKQIPFTVLFDREGRVAGADLHREQLERAVARLVEAGPS